MFKCHFSFYPWLSSHSLLPPHLQYFPVGIRMNLTAKSWAICRAVFRHKSARLIPNPTCITEGFRTIRTCTPLWSIISSAVMTFPPSVWGLFRLFSGNLVTRLFPRELLVQGVNKARLTTRLAPCTNRELHLIVAT
jgi:hypothetical protein